MKHRNALLASAVSGVLLAGVVTAIAVPASAASTGCSVAYTVPSQWPGGFTGSVVITNLGDPLSSWSLTFDFPNANQKVTQGWSATWSQSGSRVTAANVSWNGSLGTNAATTIGFNGAWSGANPVPASFALNGTTCTGRTTTPGPTQTTSGPTTVPTTTAPPGTVLSRVNTAGRVKDNGSNVQYAWPGVYFEGRIRGTGVGIVLNDSNNDYDVQVDGAKVASLLMPGSVTYWVNNLTNADHTVRLVKRTESPWLAGQFSGFLAAPGGSILAKPAVRTRQIEFIGDSFTAGYGNMSTTRDCSSNGGVNRNSNADITFGALTARTLNADYQINAWSGMGVVRNYNGQNPDLSFRTFYDRTLAAATTDVWPNPSSWRPQLVVIGLGINDFSTAINAGEPWTPTSLVAAYKTAYHGFIDKLRTRYGTNTIIVVSATLLSNTTVFAQTAQQIVQERNNQGDSRVRYWYYDDPNLDRLGCDWHPSTHDHQIISALLNNFIAALPLGW